MRLISAAITTLVVPAVLTMLTGCNCCAPTKDGKAAAAPAPMLLIRNSRRNMGAAFAGNLRLELDPGAHSVIPADRIVRLRIVVRTAQAHRRLRQFVEHVADIEVDLVARPAELIAEVQVGGVVGRGARWEDAVLQRCAGATGD